MLLNYFNNAYNAINNPAAEVQVSFDSTTDTLVCNKPGWYVENFPLAQVAGLQNLSGYSSDPADTVAKFIFGSNETAADVKNWYIMTPVDAAHPAPAEPAAPTGPAPITPTNLEAQASDGSYFHILVVDNNTSVTNPTSDPSFCYNSYQSGGQNTLGACLSAVEKATNVVVDSTVYHTIRDACQRAYQQRLLQQQCRNGHQTDHHSDHAGGWRLRGKCPRERWYS